jgi:hypothetical protein
VKNDRKREQSDRALTSVDLRDHGLSGSEISYMQLGQVTSQYRDVHGQLFELNP